MGICVTSKYANQYCINVQMIGYKLIQHNAAMVERYKSAKLQRCKGAKAQGHKGTKVQHSTL